ncbi:MAG: hypothetical protein J6T49_04360 [Bacteroidales bacterium]|nr:hypothetical protein [Bacteroidales bacterium]
MSKENHKRENRVGLYTTLIFHFSLIIILLIASIGGVVSKENTFVLDFTRQEQRQKEKEVEQMRQMVSEEVDNLLAMARSQSSQVRNVAVDANERLRDDRNANPSRVYDEARELQRKLDAAAQLSKQMDAAEAQNFASLDAKEEKSDNNNAPAYSGPSVISYDLKDRKAQSLPVPAYRGYGGGDVSVKIYVNQKGRVIKAEVIESASAKDASLWNFAVAAAQKSRFTASTTAPDPQIGSIVYRFIRQ